LSWKKLIVLLIQTPYTGDPPAQAGGFLFLPLLFFRYGIAIITSVSHILLHLPPAVYAHHAANPTVHNTTRCFRMTEKIVLVA
jgi:hypothetical protein